MASWRSFVGSGPASGLATLFLLRLRWAIAALVVIVFVATAGYVVLEHYSVIDGVFMTVITLSTVGYEEVHPLDAVGRLFTIGVIVAGFATLAYTGAVLSTLFTSGELAEHLRKTRGKRMRKDISDHVIVVGYGRVGQATARAVKEFGRTSLVIDRNPELQGAILEAGHLAMEGDATSETDLVEAGIHRALALVAAADEDGINLIVTLTARALRPDLRIVSRVNELTWQDRIVRAGASVAHSPYRSYGLSLAATAVTPSVIEMHALPLLGLVIEEIEVLEHSPLVGRDVSELGASGDDVYMLGVRRERAFHRWHELAGPIAPGDVLVALGSPAAVEALARRA